MDRYELAWAAGFFDGEGWANAVAQTGRRTAQPHAQVNQAGTSGVPDVLSRFRRALGGLGRIGGPVIEEGRDPLYRWDVSSRGDVELLHHLLLPWLGQAKLDEFAATLGRPAARSRSVTEDGAWLAWAAGLFDGEGSTYLVKHRSHVGYLMPETRITQASDTGRPEVLVRFRTIVGVGVVYGPYVQDPKHSDVYRWNASARRDVEYTLALLRPRLSRVKNLQADQVLAVVTAQPTLLRGRPDWGNRKTHCIRGHEYATARVRPYKPRGFGVQRRDSKQCLVCAREAAKTKRDAKNKSAADDGRRRMSDDASRYLLK